jgi:predicted nucleotidyltransferase
MDISRLLSTSERLKILAYVLSHPSEEIVPDRIARKVGVSRSQAHKYVAIMRGEGLVRGKQLEQGPVPDSLRLLMNTRRISEARLTDALRRRFPKATGIGVFGSWANGTNEEGSDLDVWLKMPAEPPDLEVARAKKETGEKLGAPLDMFIATPARLSRLREKSDAFYFSLYNGKLLWGEGL